MMMVTSATIAISKYFFMVGFSCCYFYGGIPCRYGVAVTRCAFSGRFNVSCKLERIRTLRYKLAFHYLIVFYDFPRSEVLFKELIAR